MTINIQRIHATIIRRPKRVNASLVGPFLYLPMELEWQQPLWGNAVRLYEGARERLDTKKPNPKVLLKPRKIKTNIFDEEYEIEPNGTKGTSYQALKEFVRACMWAGGSIDQTEQLLDAGLDVGPCAQYRWQNTKHSLINPDLDWFFELWEDVASTETNPYYLKHQSRSEYLTSKRTIPVSPLTRLIDEPREFQFGDRQIEDLLMFVSRNEGLTQEQLKSKATKEGVIRFTVFTRYLTEMERRGLVTPELVRKSGKGRPAKIWKVVRAEKLALTEEQLARDESITLPETSELAELLEEMGLR